MGLRELLQGGAAAVAKPAASAAPPLAAAAPSSVALQPTGNPEQDLANLLSAFEASDGVAPRVNPPEAARVLAEKTAPEVKGVPEPEEEEGPEVEPPTSKPAAVVAAEAAPRAKRTAAVVQKELDDLLALHNKLADEHQALQTEVAGYAAAVRAEMKAENAVTEADLVKASARVSELADQYAAENARANAFEAALSEQKALNARALAAIKQLQAGVVAAPTQAQDGMTAAELAENYPALLLAGALQVQGWEPYLGVPKS